MHPLATTAHELAAAFGCNPSIMREHYLALNEATIADRVFSAIGGID
jgi:hypothetical protein